MEFERFAVVEKCHLNLDVRVGMGGLEGLCYSNGKRRPGMFGYGNRCKGSSKLYVAGVLKLHILAENNINGLQKKNLSRNRRATGKFRNFGCCFFSHCLFD